MSKAPSTIRRYWYAWKIARKAPKHFPPKTPIEVFELGEDSDHWLVKGTDRVNEAKGEVAKWLVDCIGVDADFPDLPNLIAELKGADAVSRDDWYWEPASGEEAYLRYGISTHSQFSGIAVWL